MINIKIGGIPRNTLGGDRKVRKSTFDVSEHIIKAKKVRKIKTLYEEIVCNTDVIEDYNNKGNVLININCQGFFFLVPNFRKNVLSSGWHIPIQYRRKKLFFIIIINGGMLKYQVAEKMNVNVVYQDEVEIPTNLELICMLKYKDVFIYGKQKDEV